MIFAILLVAVAVTARAGDVRMEPSVNTFSSSKWLKEKVAIENDVLEATFVLKHDKAATAEFEKTLLDISNPKSPNYRKWLTVSFLEYGCLGLDLVCNCGKSIQLFSAMRSRPASLLPPPA